MSAPSSNATTLPVDLHPLSAHILLDMLEQADIVLPAWRANAANYVAIDIDNFRNQLRAHLQRVAIGE